MVSIRALIFIGSLSVVLLSVAINIFIHWWWKIPGIIEVPLEEYDYVIVGAGTAGSVLARRISERTNRTVLVIEAGGAAPWISSIPLIAPVLQSTSFDWAFKTTFQHMGQWGMKNQQSSWPRGKGLGGSSTINYHVHLWPSKHDLDAWESSGCKGWNYESLKSYFIRSETYHKDLERLHHERGKGGPLSVSEFDASSSPLAEAFIEGATSLGIPTGDLNGELQSGIMPSQCAIFRGRRCSAFDAFMRPVMGKPNLHVVINVLATRVIFENKMAVGVELLKPYTNDRLYVRARQEVILSAGVIGSPHLLLLSGIGPQEQLRSFNIPVIADLPGVGRRLFDHLNIPMYFHLESPVSMTTSKTRTFFQLWKYFVKGTGFLGWSNVEAIAKIPLSGKGSSQPQIYFMLLNMGSINEELFTKISNIEQQVFLESFPETHNDSKEGFVILASCTNPKGKGEVELASSNPLSAPLIDPHYLEENEDVKCFIKAMKMAARLGASKPLRKLGAQLHLPRFEKCSKYPHSLDNDDYLECWLRSVAITGYHPLGTCSMGPDDNPLAVLDLKLRVRHVQNLRVVDASSFPKQTSGGPNSLTIAVAEKASDLILHHLTESVSRR